MSVSGPYDRGPAAPATGPAHHYVFELYALDTTLNLPVSATKQDLEQAMQNRILGQVELVGTYHRR